MYNLLIADDDPFILSGICAMLNYQELQINIVGTASDGAQALEMIRRLEPELVITDVKMPGMTGLELVKACKEEGMELPVFLILTDYDEAPFIREALSYHVSDYLIKLELTPQSLSAALQEAIRLAKRIRPSKPSASSTGFPALHDKFYIRLLHNLFDTPEDILQQSSSLGILLDADAYVTAYMEIENTKAALQSHDQQLSFYNLCLQTAGTILAKYIPCHTIPLDLNHFAVLFFVSEGDRPNLRQTLEQVVSQIHTMLYNYYTIHMTTGIGPAVYGPADIAFSWQEARKCILDASSAVRILFAEDSVPESPASFSLSLFREAIQKAYSEYDSEALRSVISEITELFYSGTPHFSQALDMAGNFLHLSVTLLCDGEKQVARIFADEPDNYRCLYRYTSVPEIISWFTRLGDGLCSLLEQEKSSYKKRMILNIQQYIKEHPEEKLSLSSVASEYYISTGYLSSLFGKYAGVSFINYVNQCKVEASKKMLLEGNLKLYEIAEKLGYENAFYFSRVFKKVEGISPREFLNQMRLE